MKKSIILLALFAAICCLIFVISFVSTATAALPPAPEIETATHKLIKQAIYKEFSTTHLASRIVKFKMKKRKGKVKVFFTWHPQKAEDLAKDTYVIVKIINKVIPDFYSISLKAIHPEYMRWTKRVFWNSVITRDALFLINAKPEAIDEGTAPRRLFY